MLSWLIADSHVHVIGKALVITYMLYVHKWSARILGAGNVFYGPSLGVDEGLQMVEIDRKKQPILSQQFSIAGIMYSDSVKKFLIWWL